MNGDVQTKAYSQVDYLLVTVYDLLVITTLTSFTFSRYPYVKLQ